MTIHTFPMIPSRLPVGPERFWIVVTKTFDASLVRVTAADAVKSVDDDTKEVWEAERDHLGKYHITDASSAIADKWLDAFDGDDIDMIPWFVKDNCRPDRMTEIEAKAYENWLSEAASDYRQSVGIQFSR